MHSAALKHHFSVTVFLIKSDKFVVSVQCRQAARLSCVLRFYGLVRKFIAFCSCVQLCDIEHKIWFFSSLAISERARKEEKRSNFLFWRFKSHTHLMMGTWLRVYWGSHQFFFLVIVDQERTYQFFSSLIISGFMVLWGIYQTTAVDFLENYAIKFYYTWRPSSLFINSFKTLALGR